jgi:hypothetical protein
MCGIGDLEVRQEKQKKERNRRRVGKADVRLLFPSVAMDTSKIVFVCNLISVDAYATAVNN